MRYWSQVSCPTLNKTQWNNVRSPLLLMIQQAGSKWILIWLQSYLYSNSNVQQHMYYPSSRNWELVDSFGPAPALSWGRATGIIWEIWYLPGHWPIRRGLEQFQACQDSSCLSSTTVSRLVFRERKKIDIILRQVKREKNKILLSKKKNFYWALGPIP